ncbi:Plant organelle RNA recognition domain-containing protein [Dioscorea alata]|uniref:Plant organelle RNA recognition domain-containing protein n=1 Tax=Dioscorea alata TaxID=55571 RepID=A0ACB7VPC0_DIOAL|nr:Plant organelle RNA recognition domain-containing protein [Dioscorea alata]
MPLRHGHHLLLGIKTNTLRSLLLQSAPISSLKVAWRKDQRLDGAIERDKRWRMCFRVVRELLNEPGQRMPLRYLEKRRERLKLPIKVKTFISRYPSLLDLYPDLLKPKSEPVPFLRPSARLLDFISHQSRIQAQHEPLIISKLCKLLMMAKDRVISADKLSHVKRDFGFPDDFLCNLVPKYPQYLRLVGSPGEGQSFLELVSWNEEFAMSAIERKAEEESKLTGIRMRPNFSVKLPPGYYLRKEMREWVRDWLELPYISPYSDASALSQASPEMEKRTVGLVHELLSLSVFRRIQVPIIGKFCEEFRLSNAFGNMFTRHSGIFYVSLKGGVKTAMLREAYDELGELVDRDPLLEIKKRFVEMLDEGHREYLEKIRMKREAMKRDLELLAKRNSEQPMQEEHEEEEEDDHEEDDEEKEKV